MQYYYYHYYYYCCCYYLQINCQPTLAETVSVSCSLLTWTRTRIKTNKGVDVMSSAALGAESIAVRDKTFPSFLPGLDVVVDSSRSR